MNEIPPEMMRQMPPGGALVKVESWPFHDGSPGGYAVVPVDEDYPVVSEFDSAMDAVRWAESQLYRVVLR